MSVRKADRPLRILMLAPGISPHAVRPLKWLLQSGLEVCFFDVTDPGVESVPGYTFVKMSRVSFLDTLCSMFGGALGVFLFRRANKKQLKQIEESFSPDIVHVHFADYRALVVDRLFRCPKVLSIWGSDLNGLLSKHQRWRLNSFVRAYSRASRIVVDAENLRDKVESLTGGTADVINLHLGVDVDFLKEERKGREGWRKKLDADAGSIVIFSPRRWTSFYGHHILSEAIKILSSLVMDRRIIVVWKKSPGLPSYKAEKYLSEVLAAQNGESERIRNVVVGELEYGDFVGLLAAADILVNFPAMDAFPVLFLEAAMCRTSVVSFMHGAYRETFAEKNYVFCEKYEARDLARSLYDQVCLLGSREQVKRLNAAEITVEKSYSQDVYRRDLINCYQKLTTD